MIEANAPYAKNLSKSDRPKILSLLESLGVKNLNSYFEKAAGTEEQPLRSPVDGSVLPKVSWSSGQGIEQTLELSHKAFVDWRKWPAPERGQIVREIGNRFREHKLTLAEIITWEMGKPLQESLGEVQEVIDICDFATGLSRQINGQVLPSERPNHRMMEQWHPIGVVGIISAFNFPVAVWSWNAILASMCGNTVVWKPSEKTLLTAIAAHKIIEPVLLQFQVPEGVFNLVLGGKNLGKKIAQDSRIALVSATGSTSMGREVGRVVADRFGKSLLELGGNNAIILAPSADLQKAIPAILFGAVGTAGQRCTTTRRLIVHGSIYENVKLKLINAYRGVRIGSPLSQGFHLGPLVDGEAKAAMASAVAAAKSEGGVVLVGEAEEQSQAEALGPSYVFPALIEMPKQTQTVKTETFAPILYLLKYEGSLPDAIAIQNDVPQGLSSSLFTESLVESEIFLSTVGSDCGIANINIGTSGAEIGGAFGGEKETGGGRESGSDAWKAYMRRQTNTINYGSEIKLAQGIEFPSEKMI